jgi:hypothetical protein
MFGECARMRLSQVRNWPFSHRSGDVDPGADTRIRPAAGIGSRSSASIATCDLT